MFGIKYTRFVHLLNREIPDNLSVLGLADSNTKFEKTMDRDLLELIHL
jgi:hypothetical protein